MTINQRTGMSIDLLTHSIVAPAPFLSSLHSTVIPVPYRHSCTLPSFLYPTVIPIPYRHSCAFSSFLRLLVIPAKAGIHCQFLTPAQHIDDPIPGSLLTTCRDDDKPTYRDVDRPSHTFYRCSCTFVVIPVLHRHPCTPPSSLYSTVIPVPFRHPCTPPSSLYPSVIPALHRHPCEGRDLYLIVHNKD
jgi:hypothetical protein